MDLLPTLPTIPNGLEMFVVSLLIAGVTVLVLGLVSKVAAWWGF